MKEIIRIDPKNRVAMVEPGVTFAELQPELAKAGLSAYLPLCPRSSKSVIGSMLEREPITMPAHHWDCTDPMLCAEIIFGTGDKMRSGEAAGPDTIQEQWEIGKAQMTPFGLSQFNENRLISGAQGTIGIITWATLKCRYTSKLNRAFLIGSETLEPLIDLSYQLIRIRLGDNCFIVNGLNLACLVGKTGEEINGLRESLPAWVMFISFEGYGELPEEKVAYQEADFKDMAQSCRVTPVSAISGVSAEEVSRLLCGVSEEPYWKLRFKGGCEEIFFLTTLDKTPGFVEAIAELGASQRYAGGDMGVYIQVVVQGTSCHCEFNAYYDPARQSEAAKAKWLSSEGVRGLASRGGFFSRPYGAWAEIAYNRVADTTVMERKVKEIFDPKAILNPGKLCF
jgi:FAD/FMN-containing dehydrogenase